MRSPSPAPWPGRGLTALPRGLSRDVRAAGRRWLSSVFGGVADAGAAGAGSVGALRLRLVARSRAGRSCPGADAPTRPASGGCRCARAIPGPDPPPRPRPRGPPPRGSLDPARDGHGGPFGSRLEAHAEAGRGRSAWIEGFRDTHRPHSAPRCRPPAAVERMAAQVTCAGRGQDHPSARAPRRPSCRWSGPRRTRRAGRGRRAGCPRMGVAPRRARPRRRGRAGRPMARAACSPRLVRLGQGDRVDQLSRVGRGGRGEERGRGRLLHDPALAQDDHPVA